MSYNVFVNKKEFQRYKACSYSTALIKYKLYLEIADKRKDQELTIYDLSFIDDIPLEDVKKMIFN